MIDLRQGDCLELMKDIQDNTINLILTDPPYNISKENNFKSMHRNGIDFGKWDHDADILSWIDEAPRILARGGH